jgi:hypothetical protein
MPHIHISTEALFFGGVIVTGLVGLGIAWGASRRRAKLEKTLADYQHEERMSAISKPTGAIYYKTNDEQPSYVPNGGSFPPRQSYSTVTPSPYVQQPATVVVHDGGSNGMLTGLLLGEALAGNRHDGGNNDSYHHSSPVVDNSSSWDSGSSYDSGSSSSSSDSGGIDVSW